EPDPALAGLDIRLPRPVANTEWPEAGGYPNHAMQHLALGEEVKETWRSSIGKGSTRTGRILAQPVAAGDRVFTMDGRALVRAFDRQSGRQAWEFDATPEDAGKAVGGGIA